MSRALNFLWINLTFPQPTFGAPEAFCDPLPPKYIDSLRQAGENNPDTEVRLWMDFKRLTPAQMSHVQKAVAETMPGNVRLLDLRDIPLYRDHPLFQQAETSPGWRNQRKDTVIWRQVDTAKVLVSLQGDFDQSFFADFDFAGIKTDSAEVQEKIAKHGLLARGFMHDGRVSFENQWWGFDHRRHGFFEELLAKTLEAARNRDNGYHVFIQQLGELPKTEGVDLKDIYFVGTHDGTSAHHPGHKWSHGYDYNRHERFQPSSLGAAGLHDEWHALMKEMGLEKPGAAYAVPTYFAKKPKV